MATRKFLKDINGKKVGVDDVVFWRDFESQQDFNNTGQVVEILKIMDEVYLTVWSPNNETRHKLGHNVRKMTKGEAMLWKLENL